MIVTERGGLLPGRAQWHLGLPAVAHSVDVASADPPEIRLGETAAGQTDRDLIAALYPGLRRFAAAVGPVEIDPDDLVQDAFAAALRRNPIGALDNPQAYLRRAIVNLAANHRRKFSRFRSVAPKLVRDADPTSDVLPSDLADLERLSGDERAVLYLVEVEGLPYAEVAEQLDITAGAARVRAARARKRLRLHLTEEAGAHGD